MSVSPLSTKKVLVTTASQFAPNVQDAPAGKAVIYNAGPSLIFVGMATASQPLDPDGGYPIAPGQTQSITVNASAQYGVAVIGEGSGVAYVSYVRGDIEGISAASLDLS